MGSLSKLNPLFGTIIRNNTGVVRRHMSEDRSFSVQPSRWQWKKTKDFLHFYTLLGVIPLTTITFLVNVFIGPATLDEIPEDYVPKHWEYYRSPVTRFIAHYILNSPQQDYEKYLHFIFEEAEKIKMRKVVKVMKDRMSERADYQAYYYKKISAKHLRVNKEAHDYLLSIDE